MPKLKRESLFTSGFCLNIRSCFNSFSSDFNRAETVCLLICLYILGLEVHLFVCLLSSRSSSLLCVSGVLDWIWASFFFFGALILFSELLLLMKM